MPEQTIFPNILIEEVKISKDGVARTTTFDPPILGEGDPSDLPGLVENVKDRVQSLIDRVRIFSHETFTLTYTLTVGGATESGAKARSRTFVRAKNPFEPDVIDVKSINQIEDGKGPLKMYRVEVEVQK